MSNKKPIKNMKKNSILPFILPSRQYKKLLLIMRLSTILLLVTLLNVSAAVFPQSSKLTLKLQNVTVKDVLNEIEKTTPYKFLYRNEYIDVTQKVNVDAIEETLDNIMAKLFDPQSIAYKVFEGNIVVITDKSLQQIKVIGKVTDAVTGEPIPGVNVVILNTTNGTITDIDGKFSLEIPSAETSIVFSFVGYLSETVLIGSQSEVNIKLSPDIKNLDEVVVVGYGTQKRSDVTGSVTSVSKSRLAEIPVTNIMHALEGSTAGLQITQNSSVPGSSATMQIRGINSINANTSPFIVLDGIPFYGNTNDINSSDIESIEILKDASAVAIYGTRGSNGVILITSKRGSKTTGKPKISYSGYYGFENMAHVMEPMDSSAYLKKYADFNLQNGITQTQILPNQSEVDNYKNGITSDWLKEATQQGIIQEHTLSLNGGTENVQYYISGTHLDQKGIIKGYQYKKTSLRSNLDIKVTDFLKVGTSAFFAHNNYDGGRLNLLNALAMSPYSVPYDDNGNYLVYPMAPELLFTNPLIGTTIDRLNRGLNLTGDGYAEITPIFLKGLKYRLNASYNYNLGRTGQYNGRPSNDLSGTAEVSNSQTTDWVIENILTYSKDIDKHHFDVTALYSAEKKDYFKSSAKSVTFINDALSYYNLSAGKTQTDGSEGWSSKMLSQMGRINYSYDSRYLVTLTARRDGYSGFGANTNKYALFPSMALGWNVTNETFMKSLSEINQLKLRLSYGLTGNQAIDPNQTATTANTTQYTFGSQVYTGILYNNMGNADLIWESTTSLNFGVDFGVLNNRISGTIEVYKTQSKDLLMKRNIPTSTGYSNVWVNLGKMENLGIDITLKTVNIATENFKWTTELNFSSYRNKITELYGDGLSDINNNWFIGQNRNVVYDYEKLGIWQEGEDASKSDPIAKPGDLKFKDQLTIDTNGDLKPDSADGKITEADKVVLGRRDPKWTGGITNTFTYKNLSLRIFIQTSQGGIRPNTDLTYADEAWRRNLPADFKYWTKENKDNYWPSLAAYKNYRGYQFAEDYSYIRIKDITLSYNLPQSILSKAKIQSLTVFVTGRNLITFTDWFGWDPEMTYYGRGSSNSQGSWVDNYPVTRTFTFGVNLSL
jgi:TonB-linked SusC/RagA family outer membrane protein